MSKNYKIAISTFWALVIVDQLVKYWAREAASWVEGRTIFALWPGVFEFKLVFNKGIAFGMFQGGGFLFAPIAGAISAGAIWWSYKHPEEPRYKHLIAAILAAGATGNLIDRLWKQKVTDMFWFRLIDFPVFNIADVCITVAGIAIFLALIGDLFHPTKPSPNTPDATLGESPTLPESTRTEKE